MIENHLSGLKARSGGVMFVCSTRKVAPNSLFGAEADGELVYLLICPKCGIGQPFEPAPPALRMNRAAARFRGMEDDGCGGFGVAGICAELEIAALSGDLLGVRRGRS
jgi:hypothetical protein